jgi:predicted nicotinamide N-methyase
LGAGCGLVGIAAACLYPTASVTLTDLPAALPALRANIERNRAVLGPDTGRVRAMALDWTAQPLNIEHTSPYDLVLASDVIWLVDLVDPFLDTLQHIARANPMCVTLMTYQSRSKIVDRRLFAGLESRKFAWASVETSKKVGVFRITLRTASPLSDSTT